MAPERSHQPACPPEVRALIARMEDIMQLPMYNNAMIPTQVALDAQREGQVSSFAHFEACLRETGSRVHFIGVPLDFFGPQYTTVYPFNREGRPEYSLYAAVNGAEEAAQMLMRLGITAEENMLRLETSGLLTEPSPR